MLVDVGFSKLLPDSGKNLDTEFNLNLRFPQIDLNLGRGWERRESSKRTH